MKGLIFFLFLAITQSLLPLSSTVDLTRDLAFSFADAEEDEKVPASLSASLIYKHHETAVDELSVEEYEDQTIELWALTLHSPFLSSVPDEVAQIHSPQILGNFILVYISRLITSPPAAARIFA